MRSSATYLLRVSPAVRRLALRERGPCGFSGAQGPARGALAALEPGLPGVLVPQARLPPSLLPLNFALPHSAPSLAGSLQSKPVLNFSPAVVCQHFQVKYYSWGREPAGQRLAWGWAGLWKALGQANARPRPREPSLRHLWGRWAWCWVAGEQPGPCTRPASPWPRPLKQPVYLTPPPPSCGQSGQEGGQRVPGQGRERPPRGQRGAWARPGEGPPLGQSLQPYARLGAGLGTKCSEK